MALSVDLRERVLRAHERREGSQRVLAERFGVGLGTVNKWLRLARDEGRRAPLRPRGGPKPLGGVDPALLRELVAERNDATLAEYAQRPAERVGRRFSASVLCRALARLGPRRKKDAPGRRAGPPRHRRRTRGLAGRGRRGGRAGAAGLP